MNSNFVLVAVAAATLITTGCSGHSRWFGDGSGTGGRGGSHGDPTGAAPGIKELLRYADKDGDVTRAAMEAGLRVQFNALDTKHEGKLNSEEVEAENASRYKEDGPQYSPLIDWNQDGFVDFDEYATTLRSLFDQLDRNHDGVLTPSELKPPQGPALQEKQKRSHSSQGGSYDDLTWNP